MLTAIAYKAKTCKEMRLLSFIRSKLVVCSNKQLVVILNIRV